MAIGSLVGVAPALHEHPINKDLIAHFKSREGDSVSWGIAESIERLRRARRRKCHGARTLRRSTTKRPSVSWRRRWRTELRSAKCWRLVPRDSSG